MISPREYYRTVAFTKGTTIECSHVFNNCAFKASCAVTLADSMFCE